MDEQRQKQTGLIPFYSLRHIAEMVVVTVSLCLFCAVAQAEIYKFKDKFGRIIFTDVPQTSEYVKVELKGWSDPTPSMNPAHVRVNMEKYKLFVENAAAQYNLPLPLLHAVITVESAYNPQAVSRAGAMGLMQLMPDTAERFGVKDSFSPGENIRGGSRYLQHLMGLFKGDLNLVLAAYNAGEGAVMKYGNRIPPYSETQNYVRKVKQYQVIFSQQL